MASQIDFLVNEVGNELQVLVQDCLGKDVAIEIAENLRYVMIAVEVRKPADGSSRRLQQNVKVFHRTDYQQYRLCPVGPERSLNVSKHGVFLQEIGMS